MIILRSISELLEFRKKYPEIAFVPTMGNLHEGHLKLVDEAKRHSSTVVVSIFVNRTQFNDPKDFDLYPRTLEDDLSKLDKRACTAVFLPTEEMLYPDSFRFRMHETEFSKLLCGAHRPGHFEGVLSVVLKLIMLTGAQWVIMGKKDYQQYLLVSGMCQAYFIPTEIIGVETVREESGLAMSSRNNRLSVEDRQKAAEIYRCLSNFEWSDEECARQLTRRGFHVDYVETRMNRRLVAAFLGGVRLIDNVQVPHKEATLREI